MDQLSAALALKTLDGLTLRSAAIAENIANANTRAYRPVRVRFEEALKTAAGEGLDAIRQVRPKLEPDMSTAAGALRLDLEVVAADDAAERYGAVAEVLGRQLQLDGVAITGNG